MKNEKHEMVWVNFDIPKELADKLDIVIRERGMKENRAVVMRKLIAIFLRRPSVLSV